jgi:monofunctional biosynthetic peptidoglycan transglycosylase
MRRNGTQQQTDIPAQTRAQVGRFRGASTISQQTMKNLFLWPGRSFVRKGPEAWLTVEFGPGIYGVGAASHHYFRRSPARLSGSQAALRAVFSGLHTV